MRSKAFPNWINSGAIYLSAVLLKLDVHLSSYADKLRMRHGWRWAWGTAAMRERLSLSPNICTVSATGKNILNTSCTLRWISPRMNPTISGVHVDVWGPFLIALSRASLNQGGPVLTGMNSSIWDCIRDAIGWRTATDSIPNFPHWCKEIKVRGEGTLWISSVFALYVAESLSSNGADGGS